MKKLSIPLTIFLIAILFVGCKAGGEKGQVTTSSEEEVAHQTEAVEESAEEVLGEEVLEEMKALLIIANKDFRDEEYDEPRKILEANGVEVTVASASLAMAKGTLGMMVKPDILIDDVVVDDYDAIIFVGGSGADEYYTNQKALSIAKESVDSGKVLAAICIAPVTLGNAGVLDGKKATVYSSRIADLRAKGAIFVSDDVVQDGNIITASGPQTAGAFGQAILDAMK